MYISIPFLFVRPTMVPEYIPRFSKYLNITVLIPNFSLQALLQWNFLYNSKIVLWDRTFSIDEFAVLQWGYFFQLKKLFVRSVRGCSNNTTVKYLNNFKKIIRICLGNGWMTRDPFINHKRLRN